MKPVSDRPCEELLHKGICNYLGAFGKPRDCLSDLPSLVFYLEALERRSKGWLEGYFMCFFMYKVDRLVCLLELFLSFCPFRFVFDSF